MANSIFRLFNTGVKWNAFEGVVYQTILTVHQITLFKAINSFEYGLIGVLFSLIYIFVLFLNFGLDKSLAAFYVKINYSKIDFKKIFIYQFLIQVVLLGLFSIASILLFNEASSVLCYKFKCSDLDFNIWQILIAIIFFESFKKTLRIVCELHFLNKYISISEVCLIIFYVSTVWSLYFLNFEINLHLIFIPHLIQSIIATLLYSYFVYKKFYSKISNKKTGLDDLQLKSIFTIRLTNFVNQLSHILFSGNFLITLFSANFGLTVGSILKFINVIAVYFNVILERTFGLTSSALLSHTKEMSLEIKQVALNVATKKLFLVLYALSIFLLVNSKAFLNLYFSLNLDWVAAYLFLFAILIDSFFITFEQFFIVEAKIYYFIIVNLIMTLLFYSFYLLWPVSLTFSLIFLLIVRFFSFLILKKILFYNLNVKLNFKIPYKYIIAFFITSLFILLILKGVK